MSNTCLRLIPADPDYMPAAEAQRRAEEWLDGLLPRADEVEAATLDTVRFIDPGANWEGVECPACGADLNRWWGDAMHRASETGFADLVVRTPCCRTATTLNDLRYTWPCGFARFVLEITNPGVGSLPAHVLADLEQLLGTRLRLVWADY